MIKFVLISNKRTGSTFLQEALNSHPNIRCLDEMFMIRAKSVKERGGIKIFKKMEKEKGFTPREYLEWLGSFHNNVGFRIVYPQLDHYSELTEYLSESNMPIIHLIRSNYFEQSMSWFTKHIPNQDEKLYIDPDQLLWRINKTHKETEKYKKLFSKNKKYMEIFYEDMFGTVKGRKVKVKKRGSFNIQSKQKTYVSVKYKKRLCNFIGVNESNLSSNITKRTKWNIWDYIKNRDEVIQTLKENNWQHLIRERY